MAKRGRKKTEHALPNNLNFWSYTFTKPEEMEQFFAKGDQRQRRDIVAVLKFLQRTEPDFFEDVHGKYWLEKFTKTIVKE